MSVDPGNAGADPADPQSWNGYAYVSNNPLSYTDPDGEGFWGDLGLVVGGVVASLIPGANVAYWATAGFLVGDVVDVARGGPMALSPIPGMGYSTGVTGGLGGALNTGGVFGSGNTGPFIFSFENQAQAGGGQGWGWLGMAGPTLSDAGKRAEVGVKAGALITAPEWVVAVVAAVGIETAGVGVGSTIHGAIRMAEASRLSASEVWLTKVLATSKYAQRDGAVVFVRDVGGKFNVVVQNATTGQLITQFKHLSARALESLARNYGWH